MSQLIESYNQVFQPKNIHKILSLIALKYLDIWNADVYEYHYEDTNEEL